MNNMSQTQMVEFLQKVQKKFCAYTGQRCDCKYGAHNIGGLSESGNGCPETFDVISLIQRMTPKEFERISKRKAKPK